MTVNETFDNLVNRGALVGFNDEDAANLLILERDGLAVRCSKIPHHPHMINPDYTFVTNDAKGLELARTVPLFTRGNL